MKLLLSLMFGLLLFSGTASADYSGVMYELGSNRAKKLYDIKVVEISADDTETTTATVTGTDGKIALIEKTVIRGLEVQAFDIDHKQLESNATISIVGDKILFSKTKDGKKKEDDETKKSSLVIAGSFQKFIKSKWNDILAGKTIAFRFGVWDRLETVGFEVTKLGEEGTNEQKRVILKMKPSSMIIAALVNPIEFKFAADGGRLFEMKGRVGPKQNVNGKWKDLDAEVVYTY